MSPLIIFFFLSAILPSCSSLPVYYLPARLMERWLGGGNIAAGPVCHSLTQQATADIPPAACGEWPGPNCHSRFMACRVGMESNRRRRRWEKLKRGFWLHRSSRHYLSGGTFSIWPWDVLPIVELVGGVFLFHFRPEHCFFCEELKDRALLSSPLRVASCQTVS
jgi:hypothetical protein